MASRLKERYQSEIVGKLREQFGYDNVMQVPRLEKVIVNMGVGEAKEDPKLLDAAAKDLATIVGQKPKVNRAKKSIAGFKIRQGLAIGCSVTLRSERMYEFLDRLLNAAIPRIRDFQGLPARSFDGRGNYTIGLKEQLIFPEIAYDDVVKVRGMDIVIVTSAKSDEESRALLKAIGVPLRNS
ncbi:MAG: 50S ribosomal protein L5 [Armatimonadetes bacterium]|nr:50S ribosomal protein L5 [Armatimonadota bacterium]